jgi:eukaryotic-like serine/threonine-protein kinase
LRTTLPPSQQPAALPTSSMPSVGTQFGERYRLDALLGEGGSASVFKALDLELNEPVAIKVFHPSNEREAETLIARFKLELSLSRSLAHPNITRLFDLGSVGPWRYLTMELLEGADLLQKLEQARGPLPFREGFAWLEQTCLALQAAHERDVVHRDIKPQNIFVTDSGVVKLMDFGIARKRTAVGVTMNGMIGGTPEYMSPEQINSFSDVTFATDLYALGITTYQLFTGKLPFDFPELTRVLIAQSTETPVSPRVHNPQIPELLERLILHMVEKDPKKRPESAAWVAQQFRALRTVTRG